MGPRDLVYFLNGYLSAMTEVIFENRGTIDKFIGDAIMTVFGAPVQSGDDAFRAIKCALEMRDRLEEWNRIHNSGRLPLGIGIGIHTGEVVAGNIGSDRRLDYTVIGDGVNLASRIEGLTRFYGVSILISDETLQEPGVREAFITRYIDRVVVKGRTQQIDIYEVLGFA